jgi:hypothetical protein
VPAKLARERITRTGDVLRSPVFFFSFGTRGAQVGRIHVVTLSRAQRTRKNRPTNHVYNTIRVCENFVKFKIVNNIINFFLYIYKFCFYV